jgi:T6SS, Phospholipase effector Tle1-like, catalytic domain
MTKNLVVCCDGTWNTPEHMDHGLPSPTNVVKLYNALIKDGRQEVYYHPGVGTGRNWWDKIAGGGTGEGLDQNIKSAYRWLGTHYAPGDRIFLFGFSRGAYTVRSLGGLITKQGLLDLSLDIDPTEVWKRVDEVFAAYRMRVDFANSDSYPFHNTPAGRPTKDTTPIFFIGVWDTVGALGLPEDLALLGLFDNPNNYRFHDTALSPMVANARHAVALDERRASFAPTLWSKSDPRTDLKQVWFPGVHCDVGGGYAETGLSDGTLKWMIDEAESCGLTFRQNVKSQLKPDPLGVLHDSFTGIFKALKTKPRPAPSMLTGGAILHQSTVARNNNVPLLQGDYWPTEALPAAGGKTVNIYAGEHWNWTGFYLAAGKTYQFTAEGEWVDGKEKFSPAGHERGGFHLRDLAHIASSALGEAETIFKAATGREADFWLTRRDEHAPWFALMGYVANAAGEDERTLARGETFMIGDAATFTPKLGGYLYCYANDAWQAYSNNRGSVALTVT